MFAPAIQENPCEQRRTHPAFVRPGRAEYPGWIDLFTFSTGFSTAFVKKNRGFPHCFPLFPPSFPQVEDANFILSVAQAGISGRSWGEKRAFFLFSKRKSREKIYFSRVFAPPVSVLSILEWKRPEFSTPQPGKNGAVENTGEKRKNRPSRRRSACPEGLCRYIIFLNTSWAIWK